MPLPIIDPVAKIQSLQARLDKAQREASVLDGRRQSLREQFDKLRAEAKEAFGVDTVEELTQQLEALEQDASTKVAELEQILLTYEASRA